VGAKVVVGGGKGGHIRIHARDVGSCSFPLPTSSFADVFLDSPIVHALHLADARGTSAGKENIQELAAHTLKRRITRRCGPCTVCN
jgi:hypothetical protein